MQVSYLHVQIHSKLKFPSLQEVVSKLPAPCSQCWRVQKYPPATLNNLFPPTFTASVCALLELTISGHRFCYTRFAALYPVPGYPLPTLREVHACSCDGITAVAPKSPERRAAVCRSTHSPWAKLHDAQHTKVP